MPAVVYCGASVLSLLTGDPAYAENELRQDLWRAEQAHGCVLLVLALVTLRYVDEAALLGSLKTLVRQSIPAAAVLLPVAFFLSVLSPRATEPNALIYLACVGAVSLPPGSSPSVSSGARRSRAIFTRGRSTTFVKLDPSPHESLRR
jgi:hypothetical protein